MADPPRNEDGTVVPHDDPDILDTDGLLRYINPSSHLTPDKNRGGWRVSSGAFSESNHPGGGMSVDLERQMVDDLGTNLARLPKPEFGVVRLVTEKMRDLGLQVGTDPLPSNPYHGEVWGINTRSKRRDILASMELIKEPEKP